MEADDTDHSPAADLPQRATVTYEQVATAAQELTAAGERPNAMKIRTRIGRGSMNTIQSLWTRWRAEQVTATAGPIPRDIVDSARAHAGESIQRLLESLWPSLKTYASKDLEAARLAAERRQAALEEELAEAHALVDALEARSAAAETRAEEATAGSTRLGAQLLKVQNRSDEIFAALQAAQEAKDAAMDDLRLARAEGDRHRDAAIAAQTRTVQLQASLEAATLQAAQLGHDALRLREELSAATLRAETVEGRAREDHQRVEGELSSMRSTLATHQNDLAVAAARIASQNARLAAQSSEMNALRELTRSVSAAAARAHVAGDTWYHSFRSLSGAERDRKLLEFLVPRIPDLAMTDRLRAIIDGDPGRTWSIERFRITVCKMSPAGVDAQVQFQLIGTAVDGVAEEIRFEGQAQAIIDTTGDFLRFDDILLHE